MTLVLRYAARSDRGLVRANNQDSVYAGPRLLAVADGMGGHAAGEVASKVTIAALAPLDDDEPGDDLISQLRDAVIAGNGAIAELISSEPDLEGMGTTLTALLFARNKLGLVHVGDSRAYLMRDGVLAQITHDDSFVQSLIDEGRITEEEAATHPQRSLLLRALTGHDVELSLNVREARSGDRYLICSDGLSNPVTLETITETLRIPDPQVCADRLIELALRGGGPDNVTCIVADVVDIDFGEHNPIVGGAAGDGTEDAPPPNSPAARAGAITAPRMAPQRPDPTAPKPPDPKVRRKRRIRALLVVFVVLVLLAAGAFAGRAWILSQFYIGPGDNDEIVIYKGVRGSVFGFDLHRRVEGSCPPGDVSCEPIALDDLQPSARDAVRGGITNLDGVEGARAAIARLRADRVLPLCPQETPTPSPTPSSPTPTTTPATTPTTTDSVAPTTTAGHVPPTTGSALTTLQQPTQQPGVDCRKRKDH